MHQRLIFVPTVPTGTPRAWTDFPYDQRPARVWSLPRSQDPGAPPTLPYVPVHHQTAFLLDPGHDYEIREGRWQPPRTGDLDADGGGDASIRGEWILLEFGEEPATDWATRRRAETLGGPTPVQGFQWRPATEVTTELVIAHMRAHGFTLTPVLESIPQEARHEFSGRVCLLVSSATTVVSRGPEGLQADLTELPLVMPIMLESTADGEDGVPTEWCAFHVDPQTSESYDIAEMAETQSYAPATRRLEPVAWADRHG